MLLIVQPKNTSEYLLNAIRKLKRRLKISVGIPRKKIDIDCEGYQELQKYHNNMIERSPEFFKNVMWNKQIFFKEHTLPTDRHLKLLHKFRAPLVLLLRDPIDSFNHYMDQFKRNGRKDCDEKQLLTDLMNFHDRYMWWSSNKPTVILVYYKDLIENYEENIKKILNHYGMSVNETLLEKLK